MARFKVNHAGFDEVLRRPETQNLVDTYTQNLVTAAGRGYYGDGQQGRSRYRGIVYADTWRAKVDNGKNNTLVKVLGS